MVETNNCIVMITKEGPTKIVNFMTPRAGILVVGCGHISHIVKIHYSFENLFYSQAWNRQTKYKVIMTKEGFTQIINFMTPRAGVIAKWEWLYKSYSENTLFIFKNFLSTPRHRSDKLCI